MVLVHTMNTRKLIYAVGFLIVVAAVGVGTSMTMKSQAKCREHGGIEYDDLDVSLRSGEEASAPVALSFRLDDYGACETSGSNFEVEGTPAAFDRHVFASVHVDEHPKLMDRCGVEATPTIVVLTPSEESVAAFNSLAVEHLDERLELARMNATSPSISTTNTDVQSPADDSQ